MKIIYRFYLTVVGLLALGFFGALIFEARSYLKAVEAKSNFENLKFEIRIKVAADNADQKLKEAKTTDDGIEKHIDGWLFAEETKCLVDAEYWLPDDCIQKLPENIQKKLNDVGIDEDIDLTPTLLEYFFISFAACALLVLVVITRYWGRWLVYGRIKKGT